MRRLNLFMAIFVLLGSSSSAFSSTRIGNGGRFTAAEFIARGYVIHSYLTKLTEQERVLTNEQLAQLSTALAKTRVEVTTEILYDKFGAQVDARTIDDPNLAGQKMVQLNEAAWVENLKSNAAVYRLIFHEYLWVIGLDDSNYRISALVKFAPNVPAATPTVRTCGLTGSLYERMTDCAKPTEQGGFEELATRMVPVPVSSDPLEKFDLPQFYQWRLVSRTVDRQQIWLDVSAGVIWSDSSIEQVDYGHAGNKMALVPPYGASNECINKGETLKAGIAGGWTLPGPKTWATAVQNGMIDVLPNIKSRDFWIGVPALKQAETVARFTEEAFAIAPIENNDIPNYYRCVRLAEGIN